MKRSLRHECPPPGVEIDLVADYARTAAPVGLDLAARALAARISPEPRHTVLVGPSEVGKSALVRALAGLIVQGERPAGASAVWQVSLRTLASNVPKDLSLGDALGAIIRRASESRAKPIVYVRDLWCLRRFELEHDLAALLAQSSVRFLAEAWPTFVAWSQESADLAAVTRVLRVEEPSVERTRALLAARCPSASDATLDRVIELSGQVLAHRKLPGRAFDVLDAVTLGHADPKDLSVEDVTARCSEGFGAPRVLLDPTRVRELHAAHQTIESALSGQHAALEAVMERISLRAVGLSEPERPIGVVMLAGPAGVGKTRLAELVAEVVFGSVERLVRVPMGEFAEDWKVDQLFGQRGQSSLDGRRGVLFQRLSGIAGAPFCVLLLDEVEKAHPMAWRHLLRPLDEGTCENGNDEGISLRNALVILTTSVGEEVFREPSVGFSAARSIDEGNASVRRRLADAFPHELLDRMDHVVVCPPLDAQTLKTLCAREIEARVSAPVRAAHTVDVVVDDAVVDHVVSEAISARGVRALRRSIDRHVARPIALLLSGERAVASGAVRVSLRDGVGVCDPIARSTVAAGAATLSVPVGLTAARRADKPLPEPAVATARREY